MEKVVKAFEEALFWLKRFQDNPEADMKVMKACERAIWRRKIMRGFVG